MKIFDNVLSDELLKNISDELKLQLKECSWGSSEIFWEPQLRTTSSGSVLISDCSENIKQSLLNELQIVLPDYDDIFIKYHVWQKGSAISCHEDINYKFGATLYLNEYWNLDFGGLFIWKPKNSDIMNAVAPKYNTLILNDEKEVHMVTPINQICNYFRVSIQIFAS